MRRKKRRSDDEGMSESWLLPYADLLTLLLALFIVLFAMSEVDLQKFEKLAHVFNTEFHSGGGVVDDGMQIVPEPTPVDMIEDKKSEKDESEEEEEKELEELQVLEYEELKAIQMNIEEYINANDLADTIGTELTGEGLLIRVRTDITFDSGSAQVKDHGKEVAKEIASFLYTDIPHEIVVNGHADDRPMNNAEYASNWELSTMRAIQFMYLLLEESDIDPKWYSARGYGEYRPQVPNTSEANRAINRRVEVLILPNHDIVDAIETE